MAPLLHGCTPALPRALSSARHPGVGSSLVAPSAGHPEPGQQGAGLAKVLLLQNPVSGGLDSRWDQGAEQLCQAPAGSCRLSGSTLTEGRVQTSLTWVLERDRPLSWQLQSFPKCPLNPLILKALSVKRNPSLFSLQGRQEATSIQSPVL